MDYLIRESVFFFLPIVVASLTDIDYVRLRAHFHVLPQSFYFQVRFADNSVLTTIHVIIAWDYAYRAARISPWETMARDSNRFKLKIQSLEPILNPVLSPEHRAKIWETRMREEET